jgi:hypothetical protein
MGINLLPKDLTPDPKILKISGYLKTVVTIAGFILVASLVGLVAYFSINSITIKNSITNQEKLKVNIKAMEQTEQGLILVKDRLAKINEAGKKPSVENEIDSLHAISIIIPADIIVTESVLGKESVEMTYLANNSLSLVKLMATVATVQEYKRIDLLNFSFNSTVGYVVSVKFSNGTVIKK